MPGKDLLWMVVLEKHAMLWVISRQRSDSRGNVAMLASIKYSTNFQDTGCLCTVGVPSKSCFQVFESNRAWEEIPFLLWRIKNENAHILQGKDRKLFTVLHFQKKKKSITKLPILTQYISVTSILWAHSSSLGFSTGR